MEQGGAGFWIVTIGVAIVTSVLASAIWELFLRSPTTAVLARCAQAIHWGKTSLLDLAVIAAAKGRKEVSARFLVLVLAVASLMPASAALAPSYTDSDMRREYAEQFKELDSSHPDITKLKDFQAMLEARQAKLRFRLRILVVLFSAICWGAFVSHRTFTSLSDGIASNFHQCLTIVAPYVDDQARLTFRSRFASARSWSDFTIIAAELDAIAAQNKVQVPRAIRA